MPGGHATTRFVTRSLAVHPGTWPVSMRGSRTGHGRPSDRSPDNLAGILGLAVCLVEDEPADLAAALRHLLESSIGGSPLQAVADRLIVTVGPLRQPITRPVLAIQPRRFLDPEPGSTAS